MAEKSEIIRKFKVLIATMHGGRYVYKHPTDGMMTVANRAGYGKFAHDLDKFVADRQSEYEGAAEAVFGVMEDMIPEIKQLARQVERERIAAWYRETGWLMDEDEDDVADAILALGDPA